MIPVMTYAAVIAALLGLAALFAERVLAELRWPRRAIWVTALVASVSVPAVALLAPVSAPEPGAELLPFTIDLLPAIAPAVTGHAPDTVADASWLGWLDWQLVDNALVWIWIGSSLAALGVCVGAAVGLRRALRHADRVTLDEQDVVLSDRLGPAVVGFLRPLIVVPRWLANAESSLRSLVLDHEREHIAARDHMTLLASLLLVVTMPWNAALWWQLNRLRAAIEVDCDARVLRRGADRVTYSEALLSVRQRNARVPFGAVALTEPVSQLEQRIRIMLDKARKFSLPRVVLRASFVISLTALAFMVEAPLAQQGGDAGESSESSLELPLLHDVVYERLTAAQECQANGDTDCIRERIEELRALDLNNYETAQRLNLEAYVATEDGDTSAAAAAYEELLSLDDVPFVLRESALRTLAALYAEMQQYRQAFETLTKLLELRGVPPVLAADTQAVAPPGEYLPIVKVAPVYPPRAAARGIEGYVVVRYTVTQTGSTRDIEVVESSTTLFERAAIESVAKYKYRPRMIDGTPVEVAGVTTRINFELEPDA